MLPFLNQFPWTTFLTCRNPGLCKSPNSSLWPPLCLSWEISPWCHIITYSIVYLTECVVRSIFGAPLIWVTLHHLGHISCHHCAGEYAICTLDWSLLYIPTFHLRVWSHVNYRSSLTFYMTSWTFFSSLSLSRPLSWLSKKRQKKPRLLLNPQKLFSSVPSPVKKKRPTCLSQQGHQLPDWPRLLLRTIAAAPLLHFLAANLSVSKTWGWVPSALKTAGGTLLPRDEAPFILKCFNDSTFPEIVIL